MRHSVLPLAFLLSACATTSQPQVASQVASDNVPDPQAAVVTVERPAAVLNAEVSADPATTLSKPEQFDAWKRDFSARAIARGYDPALVARTIGQARLYERTLDRDSNQPEFSTPIWTYVDNAASMTRIERGQLEMAEHATTLAAIEQRYGVPAHVLTAIWGLESAYGRIMGDFDLFTTLGTLAFDGRRREFAENQIFAALDLIRDGYVRSDQLKSAWAGAMGMTQFIPTTFQAYAVDFDGNGNIDLWTSEADALASAANYITESGWRTGVPVLREVVLPDGFDYSQSETVTKSVADWAAMGARLADGSDWPTQFTLLETRLLVPAGHKGPKLLAFDNFDVLMRYNRSTSYVMGITSLAEALRGERLLRKDWPKTDNPLSFDDKTALQEALNAKGYDTKGVDGRIGPATRAAIRAWQTDNGLPADGYVEQTLFRRIVG